jgi:hypothetical protein
MRRWIVVGVVCSLLGAAEPAMGAATIGSDLATAGDSVPCTAPCTAMNPTIGGIAVAAPTSGVVTSYGIHPQFINAGGNFMRLRVLRPAGTGIYLGVSSSATVHITAPGLQRIAARQPITAGDAIGFDVDPPNNVFTLMSSDFEPGTRRSLWEPGLADGTALAPTFTQEPGVRLQLNATIEADADRDGFGDETQDRCPGVAGTAVGCAPVKKCKKGFVRKKVKTKSGKTKKRCVRRKKKRKR